MLILVAHRLGPAKICKDLSERSASPAVASVASLRKVGSPARETDLGPARGDLSERSPKIFRKDPMARAAERKIFRKDLRSLWSGWPRSKRSFGKISEDLSERFLGLGGGRN